MTRRGIGNRVSDYLLERIFRRLQEGSREPVSELLLQLIGLGQERFAESLTNLIHEKGWYECSTLLQVLLKSRLANWIPTWAAPIIGVIDLERSPQTGKVHEFALVLSRVFLTDPQIASLKAEQPDGLTSHDIGQILSRKLDLLVGHNIRDFDLPILEEMGVTLPDCPIVDTLELSLLKAPRRASHALNASHHAEADARATLDLFSSIDRYWVNIPEDQLRNHFHWNRSQSPVTDYFRWVAARRGITYLQEGEATSWQWRQSTNNNPPRVESTELDSILNKTASAKASIITGWSRSVNSDDIPELICWSSTAARTVSVPGHVIRRFRSQTAARTGQLDVGYTALHTDSLLNEDRASSILEQEQGIAVSYLAQWLRDGGSCLADVHPIARTWMTSWLDDLFSGNFKASSPAVVDHELALRTPANALFLAAEQLDHAVAGASAARGLLNSCPESIAKAASTVIRSRNLALKGLPSPFRRTWLRKGDLDDPQVKVMQDLLLQHDRATFAPIFGDIADPSRLVILELNERTTDRIKLSLHAMPLPPLKWLRDQLSCSPAPAIACSPIAGTRLGLHVEEVLGRKIRPTGKRVERQTMKVAIDGSLGTVEGLGRAMVAAMRRILATWRKYPEQTQSVLGIPDVIQPVLSAALKKQGVDAHAGTRFGDRSRTVARLADTCPISLITDSRLEPLPPSVRHVLLRRMPFPGLYDPDIALAIEALPPNSDPFEKVILPRLLSRLSTVSDTLRTMEVDFTLLDRRAAIHTSYRRSIEEVVGPIREVAADQDNDLQADVAQASQEIADRLQELGLMEGRGAYEGTDPTPLLTRLLGPTASWRPNQKEVIDRLLAGRDTLAVLPTGSGKTLCYQIPALVFAQLGDHLTIVISPLIALMRDQIRALRQQGVWGSAYYNSALSKEERRRVLSGIRLGWIHILYIAPEQIMNDAVRQALLERGVRLIVIDEAHCISEWGHDFRPEYRKIPDFINDLATERAAVRPIVAAFTATASRAIERDVRTHLGITEAAIVAPLRRQDIHPRIQPLEDSSTLEDRIQKICSFLKKRPGHAGTIYATTRKRTEEIALALRKKNLAGFPSHSIDWYHAGVEDREAREQRFLPSDGATRIIVATTAFGMGLDKPDIRWIVHADAPGSIEAYTQEIGRAARAPGIEADTLALISKPDLDQRQSMARPLAEQHAHSVLQLLRARETNTGGVARLELLAGLTVLQSEQVASCLFNLERAGILHIEGRTSGLIRIRDLGKKYDPGSPLEASVLQYVRKHGVPVDLVFSSLAAHEFAESGVSSDELERIVRSMIHDQLLVQEARLIISAPETSVRDRHEALETSHIASLNLAENLDMRLSSAGSRWLTLSPKEIGALAEQAKLSLERFDHLITKWRSARLLVTKRSVLQLSLLRPRNTPIKPHETSTTRCELDLMRRIEEGWEKSQSTEMELSVQLRRREESALSELAALGIIRIEDLRPGDFGYRFKWTCDSDQDPLKLATLNFSARRKSAARRHQRLSELFSSPRSEESVWSFIEEYFSEDEHIPIDPTLHTRIRSGLNEQQLQAVEAPAEHPLLINAAAGTGKTHVLAHRVLRLQSEEHIDADRILVLSFSRTGAAAIADRVASIAEGLGLRRIRAWTFHSFCYRMLRLLAPSLTVVNEIALPVALRTKNDYLNRRRVNSLLAKEYQRLLEAAPAAGPRRADPAQKILDYSSTLDSLRSGHPELDTVLLTSQDLHSPGMPSSLSLRDGEGELPTNALIRVWGHYDALLRERNLIDFAGMVTRCLAELRTNDAFKHRIQADIQHLLVDEFQDTSRAQEEVMRLAIGPHASITVVGDNDQTIYSYNGSDVRNILNFADRNRTMRADATTAHVSLEQNYRSTERILAVASRLIELNTERLPKRIRPAAQISDRRRSGYRERNAVLRLIDTGSASQAIACACESVADWLDDGIPAREICILSRINPHSNPPRALLNQARELLRRMDITVRPESRSMAGQKGIRDSILRASADDGGLSVEDLLGRINEDTAGLRGEGSRLRAVLTDALSRGIESVSDLLLEIESMSTSKVDLFGTADDGVALKTIHAAKGEEYRRVIVLHLGGTFFPVTSRALDATRQKRDLEEERRLLYVAITRAEEEILLTGESGNQFFSELQRVAGPDLVTKTHWTPHRPLPPSPSEPAAIELPDDPEPPYPPIPPTQPDEGARGSIPGDAGVLGQLLTNMIAGIRRPQKPDKDGNEK